MQHIEYHSNIFLGSSHLSSVSSVRNIRRQNTLHSVTAECRVLEYSKERQDIIRTSHIFLGSWCLSTFVVSAENRAPKHPTVGHCRMQGAQEIFRAFTIRHFECNTQGLRTLNLCCDLHVCGLSWSVAECRVLRPQGARRRYILSQQNVGCYNRSTLCIMQTCLRASPTDLPSGSQYTTGTKHFRPTILVGWKWISQPG